MGRGALPPEWRKRVFLRRAAFGRRLMVSGHRTGYDRLMAALHETTLALRFFGDDLDPDEVTARLGCPPTKGAKKGGIWITKRGTENTARTGSWLLISNDRQPGDLNAQVADLLSLLSDDLLVWADFTARFDASVFCGIFVEQSNEGEDLSTETLQRLSSRNLRLSLNIYAPTSPD